MGSRPTFRENLKAIGKPGVRGILLGYSFFILQAVAFFIAAGRLDIPRALFYFGLSIVCYMVSTVVMIKLDPEIIRVRSTRHEGAKPWDKAIIATVLVMTFAAPVVAGLDVGRFRWSSVPLPYAGVGSVFFIASIAFVQWAMLTNPHFEPTVRIQKERGHKVITGGPYRYIRHPGYAGAIVLNAATPLIIGSLAALIPTGIIILALIIRTALEDRMLRRELDGYAEYAKRVRYRLCPGVW